MQFIEAVKVGTPTVNLLRLQLLLKLCPLLETAQLRRKSWNNGKTG
ncbi:hypothetical protein [Kamptonema animale]|nr:hypothetical protein [Kamptonema animale]